MRPAREQPAGEQATGIVLAGGRSRRFGRDKLSELLDGRPLLHHPILALAAVCGEVIVAGPVHPASLPALPELPIPLRVVGDPEPYGGPLVGLRAGLAAARWPFALVAGGDMSHLAPALLAELLRRLREGHEAVALRQGGQLRPLPCALRTSALPAIERHLAIGRRSLHEVLEDVALRELDEAAWRPLDPDAGSLRDVDRPEDLG